MKSVVIASLLFTSNVALAHPGHGTTSSDSLVHYATEPVHVGLALMSIALSAVAIGWFCARSLRRSSR